MAHHKSAKKRIRRNERARVVNKTYLSNVRTTVKKFKAAATAALEGGDKSQLAELYKAAQSALGKAAAKGLLHANNAERRIGRLAIFLKKSIESTAEAAAPAKKKKTTKKKTTKKKATKKKASKKKA